MINTSQSSKLSTNNYSQNRGSEFISSMRDYTYSDTFYKHICDEQSIYYSTSFPQKVSVSCGKSVN